MGFFFGGAIGITVVLPKVVLPDVVLTNPVSPNKVVKWHPGLLLHIQQVTPWRMQLANQWREGLEGIEFIWVSLIWGERVAGAKCNSMHILSRGIVA